MADLVWLAKNNLSSIQLNDSSGDAIEIDSMEAFGPGMQAFLIALYSLTSFMAFTGNSLVILVELYGKRSARNLRKFLINLAISDILIGVLSVPFIYTDFMLGRWIFPRILCPIAQFVQLLSVFVTTYTLTAIGLERYIATLHPLSYTNSWLRSHCNLILQLGWLFGGVLASVVVIHTKAVAFQFRNETYYDCRHDVDWAEDDVRVYTLFSFVFTFLLPMLFITISYGAIARRLLSCTFLNTSKSGAFYDRRNTEFVKKMKVWHIDCSQRRRVFKMLVLVVIMFVSCWLPMKLFMLFMAFWPEFDTLDTIYEYYAYFGSYFVCHFLSMANSFVNPIIYCFMSKSFRADLFELITTIYNVVIVHKKMRNSDIKNFN